MNIFDVEFFDEKKFLVRKKWELHIFFNFEINHLNVNNWRLTGKSINWTTGEKTAEGTGGEGENSKGKWEEKREGGGGRYGEG